MFNTYFQLGFDHILDIEGFDHLLFLVALSALYGIKELRQIIVLVTAFTIGHSLTLALASFNFIQVNSEWIEFLIPISILLTVLYNLFQKNEPPKKMVYHYGLALGFGLLHGMAFSNYFRSLLGKDQQIWELLLPFNLGVEVGQLLIVGAVLLLGFGLTKFLNVSRKHWSMTLNLIAFLGGIYLLIK